MDFIERFGKECAIETGASKNLYDIGREVTQTLIEQGFWRKLFYQGSMNKHPEFVLQLLRGQKDTFDGLHDFVKNKRGASASHIKELQGGLSKGRMR